MVYTRSNFSKKQRIRWCFDKCDLIKFFFTLGILFSLCGLGNNSMLLEFDVLGAPTSNKLDCQCSCTPNSKAEVENDSELCKNATFDAIITFKDETFVLKGEKYWKLMKNGLAPGYPKLISEKWAGLPGNISTAFTSANGRFIYFFEGTRFWKYNGDKMIEGYPKPIATEFPDLPIDSRAAFIWSHNGMLYFFKDEFYYEFDITQRPYKDAVEKKITGWHGLPPNVYAAMPSSGSKTYFFKGDRYYKYDDEENNVVVDDPPYPRRVSSDWFGCAKKFEITEE